MLLGADTGFFVAFANSNPRAVAIWQQFVEGQHTLVISALTVHEIMVYFFRRGESNAAQEWLALLRDIAEIEIVSVTAEIAAQAARYRHGLGLSTVDSIILTTFVVNQCETLLTTDNDFRIAGEQNVISVEIIAS